MWLINGFREAIVDVGLLDIHMEGTPSSGSRVYIHQEEKIIINWIYVE